MARRRQWHLLQYSCLEYPTDGGAWWAAVYGVAQSRTRLRQLSSSSSRIMAMYFSYTTTQAVGILFNKFQLKRFKRFSLNTLSLTWM